MTVPVIAIVGPSDSGKTRVATALIQELVARGYRVAAVKHCPHGHQVDQPDTDSARLYASGAAKVLISSPGQLTSIQRAEEDTPLEQIVASLDPSYHLVVAEGFKGSSAPKVLVAGGQALSPPPQNLIAVVGKDGVSNDEVAQDLPYYSFQELSKLGDQIQRQVLGEAREAPGISLVVDGVAIPMTPFPAKALAEVVYGFLKALKDVHQRPKRVWLFLSKSEAGSGEAPDRRDTHA